MTQREDIRAQELNGTHIGKLVFVGDNDYFLQGTLKNLVHYELAAHLTVVGKGWTVQLQLANDNIVCVK